tara:strand:+ start:2120 stop:4066 length:1947 start_codon:yes stop_codon:yes gene_type:complete
MAIEKITEEELVSRIKEEITSSLGYMGDTISQQRERAMDYYYGLPFGNEVEGRSQFVDTTVADTIEWIKPSLMRVFASGDEMVRFNPVGPEDVPMAKQATDYVNYVFMRQNQGWEVLYSWFTDALMQKNGIVKVWWEEEDFSMREEYRELNEIELEAIISDDDIEVIEHTENEVGGEIIHDLVVARSHSKGKVRVENVPPDEFLIARESKDIQEARFVCHRVKKTLSDLREMYGDVDPEELGSGGDDFAAYSPERLARYAFDNSAEYWDGVEPTGEESMRTYWLHESYIKTDYDGDGIAELRKICTVGDYVFENEAIDAIPFVSITPITIPHKFYGLSVADLVMDLQLIKSTLMRGLMDNMYNQNFGRYAVLEGQANLDDLLTQRPGGVVRVKSPNAITPLATPALQPYSFQMLEYLDGIREARAGVSRMSQGMNENALTSHTTATAVTQVMTASQSRVELIARNFAETGVKQLMKVIYSLLQKYHDEETVVQLRGEWVPIRPFEWITNLDCTVSVGLGNGNKDQQAMHLSQMMQFASQAMAGGLKIVNEKNLYNMGAALIKNMGFANVQDFLTDPEAVPDKPNPKQQLEQAELELRQKELNIKAADVQIKAQRLQIDAQEAQVDAQLKVAELTLEREQNRAVAIGAT